MIDRKNTHDISTISRSLTEVYIKALAYEEASNVLLEKSLRQKSMKGFLITEAEEDGAALTESDVEQLKAATEKMQTIAVELATALDAAGGKFDGTKAAVEALAKEIPDPGTLANMILDPKPGEIADAVEGINEGISNAGKAAASVIEAITLFGEELSKALGDVGEDMKAKTLNELGELAEAGELKDSAGKEIKLDAGRLRSGAEKAVAVPGWCQQAWQGGMDAAKGEAGGFMKQVGSFFKGLFGSKEEGIDPGTFADEIMECTVEELGGVVEAVGKVKEAMTEATEEAASASTAAQAGAAQAEEGGEGGAGGDPAKAEPRPEFDVESFLAALEKKYPEAFAKFKEAGGEATEDALADEVEEIQSGELSPEEAMEDVAEETAEGGIGGKSWEEVKSAVAGGAEDGASAEKVLASLGGEDAFKDALKDKVTFEEARTRFTHSRSLAALIYETVSFEDLAGMSGADELGDDVDKQGVLVQVAQGINDEVGEEVITDIPEVEERDAEEPPPASEEEGEEEQEDAQEELQGAVQDAMGSDASPGAAVMAALDGWVDGLSATSQKSMQAKDRIGGLKSNIQTALDGAAETLAKAISDAIQQWRGEHEETLIKSKRFAKKNFDSLSDLIPKMAQELLKKTDESGRKLTKGMVRRYVHRVLDRHFGTHNVLTEGKSLRTPTTEKSEYMRNLRKSAWSKIIGSDEVFDTPSQVLVEDHNATTHYDEDQLISARWGKIAGLGDDSNG